MSDYWAERNAKAQTILTKRGIRATEKQLSKMYSKSMKNIIGQFELTYNKVFATIAEGKEVTPADLYKLDTYWKMQGQLKKELEHLGNFQDALFSEAFVAHFQQIYESVAIKDGLFFNEIDKSTVEQFINQIWCADGKSWSSRIWTNTDRLQQALNDSLFDCVVTGKNPSQLKHQLMDNFKVSFSRADTIVRTEMQHIQIEAAKRRYMDSGIKEVEVWADKDERRCEVCGKLHKTRHPIGGSMPIPAHPKCRCSLLPVIE